MAKRDRTHAAVWPLQRTHFLTPSASTCSIRITIFDGATFSTPAIFTTVRMVGLFIPRSIRLM
jgi:hypothetical protein